MSNLALCNRVSNQALKKNMLRTKEIRITISFYKYFLIDDPHIFRNKLYALFHHLRIFGRVYIAHEGVNAQISILKNLYPNIKKTLYFFHKDLKNIYINHATDNNGKSFWVLRMKIRKKIVNDNIKKKFFDIHHTTRSYLKDIKEINTMLDDPRIIFLDIRNYYEYEVGHFEKSIAIPSSTFRDQLLKIIHVFKHEKNKKIVIYCTGGIRCEKASAWMYYNGFKNVYQIQGGIIKYVNLARKYNLPVRFKGKLFVFDERMGEQITEDIISFCHQCNVLCNRHVNCKNNQCHKLFIQCFLCENKFNNFCSTNCSFTHSNKLKFKI